MSTQLSVDLEHCVLHAAMQGHLPLSAVKDEELSKVGRWVLAALRYLGQKHEPPHNAKTVFVTAVDVLGGARDLLRPFCRAVRDAGAGREVGALLDAIRRKRTLVSVINAAGDQLARGELDASAITTLLERESSTRALRPLSECVSDRLPTLPTGPEIRSLPKLDRASGGLTGLWAIGGTAGAGKSTLALQLGLEYGRQGDVLYYDLEQGEGPLLAHLALAFGGDTQKVKDLTRRIYIRDTVRTLTDDLNLVKPPAMLIFDSIQALPTNAAHRRESLDVWVTKCNTLKRRGYCVIMVSELNRENYGHASQKGFKETGEIEYKADFGIQLIGIGDTGDVEVHCVKNRHRQDKGHLFDLYRKNGWLFTEEWKRSKQKG